MIKSRWKLILSLAFCAVLVCGLTPSFAQAETKGSNTNSELGSESQAKNDQSGNGKAADSKATGNTNGSTQQPAQNTSTNSNTGSGATSSLDKNTSSNTNTNSSGNQANTGSTTPNKNTNQNSGGNSSQEAPSIVGPTFVIEKGSLKYVDAGGKRSAANVASGWIQRDGEWFLFSSPTAFVKSGWAARDGAWYYFDAKGRMKTGWIEDGGQRYFLKSNGAMATGWQNSNEGWRYLKKSGAMAKGWVLDGAWYYLDPSTGIMKTDWFQADGKWYWAYSSGSLWTSGGWWYTRNAWYYFRPGGGEMVTGWLYSGDWYYLGDDGKMKTGWVTVDGKKYFLKSSGAMASGWYQSRNGWLYFKSSGEQATGWIQDSGWWYYLDKTTGIDVANCWKTIDNEWCHFDSDGRWWPGQYGRGELQPVINSASNSWEPKIIGGTVSNAALSKISQDMWSIWNAGSDVGFMMIDLRSGAVLHGNCKKYFYTASSIKGPYACAAAANFPSLANSMKNTFWNTISWSSNDDYLRLRSSFGGGVMASYMSQAGVNSFSPYSNWVDMRPIDLAKLWVRNYEYFSYRESCSDWLRPYFQHTSMSYIDDALGGRYTVYSKPGWIWSNKVGRNDGGVVLKSNGAYVLAVMSTVYPQDEWMLRQLVSDIDAAQKQLG